MASGQQDMFVGLDNDWRNIQELKLLANFMSFMLPSYATHGAVTSSEVL